MTWSKTEEKIARQAFDLAYEKKGKKIIEQIKNFKLSEPEDAWRLADFIKKQQKEVHQLFDYRYSQLTLVFGLMVKINFLSIEELDGLSKEKIDQIKEVSS